MTHSKTFPAKSEDGIVALFVVGIMIILLSLTTVAFTKLMGRESRQALDRALSTQAYYAAESGLNDAKDYINKHPGLAIPATCNSMANLGYPPYLGPSASVASNVNKVTCVIANTTPRKLDFTIQPGQSTIFPINQNAPGPGVNLGIGKVLFSWDNANAPFSPADTNNYKPAASRNFTDINSWNSIRPATTAPVLEVSFYPVYTGVNAADLPTQISRSRTVYLYPSMTNDTYASTYIYGGTGAQPDGLIVNNSCQKTNDADSTYGGGSSNNVYHCNTVFVHNVPISGPFPVQILVKVTAFYGPAKLRVMALPGTNDGAIKFQNAQVVLDSTGKGGSDVLKRLQTVIDYHFNEIEANDAIETALGLCKRLEYNLTTGTAQVDPSADPSTDPYTSTACHTLDNPNQVDPL